MLPHVFSCLDASYVMWLSPPSERWYAGGESAASFVIPWVLWSIAHSTFLTASVLVWNILTATLGSEFMHAYDPTKKNGGIFYVMRRPGTALLCCENDTVIPPFLCLPMSANQSKCKYILSTFGKLALPLRLDHAVCSHKAATSWPATFGKARV